MIFYTISWQSYSREKICSRFLFRIVDYFFVYNFHIVGVSLGTINYHGGVLLVFMLLHHKSLIVDFKQFCKGQAFD